MSDNTSQTDILRQVSTPNDFVVACTCRNENKYIQEFCEHYYALGFDKIVLCNNVQTTQDENLLSLPYINQKVDERKLVILTTSQDEVQKYFYGEILVNLEFKWLLIVDADELMILDKHDTIQEFVDSVGECDCILVNWKLYGYNGLFFYDNRKMVDRFTQPCQLSMPQNRHIKPMIRKAGILGKHIIIPNPHIIYSENGLSYKNALGEEITYFEEYMGAIQNKIIHEVAWINHYYSKSIEEFIKKRERGMADHPKEDKRPLEDFWKGNDKTIQAQQHFKFAIDNHIGGYGLPKEEI